METKRDRPYSRGNEPVSHESVVAAIRQEIIEGKFSPGDRLPTYDQLQRRFSTTRMTVHRACERLMEMGFAQSKPKVGTYVTELPPHLYRYAIAFPSRLDGVQYWTDFWTTLHSAAKSVVESEPPRQLLSFYDITGHADGEDYQRLMADVRARRLAGIILLSGPHLLQHSPLLDDDCPVPRVFIGGDMSAWKIPSVGPDFNGFLDRAIEHAARRSCRRPTMISLSIGNESTWKAWSTACRRHGIEPARWQLHGVPVWPDLSARNLVQFMMQLPADCRPDALIVGDDHLVEEVSVGLLKSHLSEEELPTVIAHTNFPKLPRAPVPVTYLGFDSVQIIRSCIDVLDAQRHGKELPQTTLVPAIFASEQIAACGAPSTNQRLGVRDVAAHPSDFSQEKEHESLTRLPGVADGG